MLPRMILALPLILLFAALSAEIFYHASLEWRPEGYFESAGMSAIMFLAGASIIAVPLLRRMPRKAQVNTLLATASVLLAVAILEAGAYVLNDRFSTDRRYHTRGPELTRVNTPDPEHIAGITGETRFTTGRRGIRAAAAPQSGDARWLAIGGSTTECVYLDDTETWPWLAGDETDGVWMGNVGISGFDTRQHLLFLQQSSLLDGVEGVVLQTGINDLWRFLANEETESVFLRFDGDAATRSPRAELTWNEPIESGPLWTRSNALRLFRTARAHRDVAPRIEEGAGGEEYAVRRAARRDATKTDTLPNLTRGVNEYENRVRRLIHTARERGMRVVLTTQPVLWRADLPAELRERCWFGWLEDGSYLTVERLREAMDAYNAALRKVCDEEDAVCVDLGSMQGNAEYFYDDCHFTEAGARAVGAAVAEAIRGIRD